MKTISRISAVVMSLAMMVSLAACGTDKKDGNVSPSDDASNLRSLWRI
ncbi:MAG: hypothetical protein IIU00_07820 [Clostridia bacterium]|nr:hypothetical protein [Clostridia bacterium]